MQQRREHRNRANALKFIQLLLDKVFPKCLEMFPNDWMRCFFHVDGASIHTAQETTTFLDEGLPTCYVAQWNRV